MKRLKNILFLVAHPCVIWIVFLAILSPGLLLYIFAWGRQYSLIAYVSYVISAYTLIVVVIKIPDILRISKALIYSNPYTRSYLTDTEYRMTISLYGSLFVNLLYAVFKFLTSLLYGSVWFGAIAVYYVILSVIRFLLLKSVHKISLKKSQEERFMHELHSYRFCGYLMFVLNIAMVGMIIQMVWKNKGYEYPGSIIYASAAYTFYCMVTAIINVVKVHKMDNPVLSAAKMLSFAGALMSILTLQTAMLEQFGGDDAAEVRQMMNTITGAGVFIIVFVIAVFMVMRANHELEKLKVNNFDT